MEPPGPAGACHRAGPPGPASGRPDTRLRPDPVGRPDDKLKRNPGPPYQYGKTPFLGFAASVIQGCLAIFDESSFSRYLSASMYSLSLSRDGIGLKLASGPAARSAQFTSR